MRIKGKLLIGLSVAVLSVGLYGCAKTAGHSKVLAIVNGKPVTVKDYNREMSNLPKHVKNYVDTSKGEKYFLNNIVTKRILVDEAYKEGINKSKEFKSRLALLKEQLMLQILIKKHMTPSPVTEAQAKAYYEKFLVHGSKPLKGKKAKVAPFSEIKGEIMMMLGRESKMKNLDAFVSGLKKKADVKYFYNNLPKFELQPPPKMSNIVKNGKKEKPVAKKDLVKK